MVEINRKVGRIDQKLERRSYLVFEFPGKRLRRIPLFENPIISENKRPILIKYQPLNRPSTLFNYFGSEARQFSFSFNITLPHIIDNFTSDILIMSIGDKGLPGTTSSKDFFEGIQPDKYEHIMSKGNTVDWDSDYIQHVIGEQSELFGNLEDAQNYKKLTENLTVQTKNANFFQKTSILDQLFNKKTDSQHLKIRKASIDLVIYWINLIRASVVGNTKNANYGPPIIRINHGIMYQDIPCICADYKLAIDESAGHDASTLLPRLIQISLTLQEIRHGNFREFSPSEPVKRDNVVGWEAVIDDSAHTMDSIAIERFI